MTTKEILSSLSSLEQELSDMKSARLLVEDTVSSYKEVRGDIRVFFSEFEDVINSLNAVASELDSVERELSGELHNAVDSLQVRLDALHASFADQYDGFVNRFMCSVSEAGEKLEERTKPLIEAFETNNMDLMSGIRSLAKIQDSLMITAESVGSLKSDIENVRILVCDSQKDQNKALENISHSLRTIGEFDTIIFNTIKSELENRSSMLAQRMDNIAKSSKWMTIGLIANAVVMIAGLLVMIYLLVRFRR